MSKLKGLLTFVFVAAGLGMLAPGALASGPEGPPTGPTTPPFTQCPAIGLDTSCQFLIDVTSTNPKVPPRILRDGSQAYYDGSDDVTVAVQNDSTAPLASIHVGVAGSGDGVFGFDGDGDCSSSISPQPEGCPFGAPEETTFGDGTDYYGPDNTFTIESTDGGTVDFTTPLQPGQYTYFTLEAPPYGTSLVAGEVNDTIATMLATTEGEGATGNTIAVPAPVEVTDTATLAGEHASEATGKVTYRVYGDANCTELAAQAGEKTVTNGAAEPSNPVGKSLATNHTYYWQATYTGDAKNSEAVSVCGDETMTFGTPPVTAGTVSTNLVASNGASGAQITVPPGTAVHDTVTVAGAPQSGRITYYVFSDSSCTTQIKTQVGGGVVNNGVFPASGSVTLPVGTYYFQAAYSGGGGLAAGRSLCGSEVLTVAVPPPPPPPNSSFTIASVVANPNGTITITFIPAQSGTATLVVTVPTASIASTSATAAKAKKSKKCKAGQVKIKGKCRPSTTVAGTTTANGTAGVPLTLTVHLSGKIKSLLKKGKTVHLVATLTYKSSLGGTATVNTFAVTIKGKRSSHHHHK
ncbi:MAG: hypothetical protein ABSH36_10880 [Solirubrobacteraceae bacterium]